MDLLATSLLNGLTYGFLLFMLAAGLTLVFSLMGVMNFAHASLYMLGAYVGAALAGPLGFRLGGAAAAPLLVGLGGCALERWLLRPLHARGHVAELLFTFGLAFLIEEAVKLVWGAGSIEYRFPPALEGSLFKPSARPTRSTRASWCWWRWRRWRGCMRWWRTRAWAWWCARR
jgi:branched-chain amino acid transport system permease protein